MDIKQIDEIIKTATPNAGKKDGYDIVLILAEELKQVKSDFMNLGNRRNNILEESRCEVRELRQVKSQLNEKIKQLETERDVLFFFLTQARDELIELRYEVDLDV